MSNSDGEKLFPGGEKVSLQKPDNYSVQVLDRTFSIVEMLAEGPRKPAQISEALKLHRSTVFRLLSNLEKHGYVSRDSEKNTYRLALKLLQLGSRAVADQVPIRKLRDSLEELALQSGYTTQIWSRAGLEAVCVEQVESPKDFRLVGRVGISLPLNLGAVGKLLLAYSPQQVMDDLLSSPLQQINSATVTNPKRLRRQVRNILEHGWVVERGEMLPNAWALAAPIFGSRKRVDHTVCVLAAEEALSTAGLERVRKLVVQTANQMSTTLGHQALVNG